MKIRGFEMRAIAILAGYVLLICAPSALAEKQTTASTTGQMGETEVKISGQLLRDSVWMIIGRGGNIGLSVGDDGVYMIDDQYAPLSEPIGQAIAQITDQPVRFVLNTHRHGDHVGGNEYFKGQGALIVAHDNVRARLSVDQDNDLFGRQIPASPAGVLPVVTYSDALTFHLNGDTIRVFHVAHAHTDGDSVIHFENANVVHMGDVFFSTQYPFIDVANGGSIGGTIAAIDIALPLMNAETIIIPGHGPVSNRAELVSYRDMLTGVARSLQGLIDAGKSLEEAIAAAPTSEWDEHWGNGFIKPEVMVKMVYEDLSR
jgi:glyoxylase-like metal-dependent hydrolase (beta-lactamase superfamily II)